MEPAPGAVATAPGTAPVARVPVTILAGFLGSGKTTLLNRILAGDHGRRVTVFVNDFGSIDIDGRLVQSRDATTITLDNGCVCCSVSNDLVSQLAGVLEGPDRPEYVLVETSGVSDPGKLLVTLRDPYLRGLSRIDGVITLVDASTVDDLPASARELTRRQLASADVIVLNKVDLVPAARVHELRERMSYPGARVVEASFGKVPLAVVLGMEGGDERVSVAVEGAPDVDHRDVFSTWSWTCSRPLTFAAVRAALGSLPADIYRAKGFLHLVEAPGQRIAAHVVGRRVDLRPHGAWGADEPRSELVFIALEHRIDAPAIRSRLAATVAAAPA